MEVTENRRVISIFSLFPADFRKTATRKFFISCSTVFHGLVKNVSGLFINHLQPSFINLSRSSEILLALLTFRFELNSKLAFSRGFLTAETQRRGGSEGINK
jgi:hypothetical protein